MNFDKHTYELINDFLDGKLPPEEKLAFETRLDQDIELQEELETYKLTNLVVKTAASNELRREIQSGINEYDQSIKSRWFRNGLIVLFAISLISASGIYWYTKKHSSEKKMASKHMPKSDNSEKIKQGPPSEDQIIKTAEEKAENVPSPKMKEPKSPERAASVDTIHEPVEKNLVTSISDSLSNKQVSKKDRTDNFPARKDTVQNKTSVPELKTIDCSRFSLAGNPKVTAACADKNDGIVDFSDIRSTKASEKLTVSSGTGIGAEDKSFERLYSGYYTFTISNQEGCSIELEVYVPEKNCFPKDFIINPSAGESWAPPVESSEIYSLNIMDAQGKTVYSSERVQNITWEGTDQYGSPLPAGLYVYLIKLGDQSVKSGQITIIR